MRPNKRMEPKRLKKERVDERTERIQKIETKR